jgi:hypothetical protein
VSSLRRKLLRLPEGALQSDNTHMFKFPNESFNAHISISCPLQCWAISIFVKPRLLWTKIVTPPFSCDCNNGLLNCNIPYEPSPIVNTLCEALSGTKHEGSLDADDLIVLLLSFLILLYFDGKF